MKNLILVIAMFASSLAFAGEGQTAEKKAILKTVMSDVMLRGALEEARTTGECEGSIISATNNGPSGIDFEAQINCTSPANEFTGEGAFLMINVKGRVFGDFLENSVITVQKAG